ncbi:Flp1 family type IVb pilin [Lachnoanaerobaculum saburreum]|jgi:hypothetical protein|uniref:Flagellin-like domain protein n=1 Tax=Lachnoanaerobaculum saburreum TaxID=467210 RepID=A0A133ZYE6_9FIRM|nr:Flp1 family type IVb pilin [Lachnoanaerobaculum saburreum]KXB60477.1 flagellin-like domain protein [Lachnoanaerobaculum saburreum]MBS6727692.1 hypothetical protein [Lachnospiraceae bacterium oral taxon 082]MDU5596925.1 Flp1 family type IVb pilin [Lachnospiraceae bacterium]
MEKMFELIDLFVMAQAVKLQGALKAFKEEERGASDMVAVMVLIVIIIALAALFNQKLKGAVESIFAQLTSFVETRGGGQ